MKKPIRLLTGGLAAAVLALGGVAAATPTPSEATIVLYQYKKYGGQKYNAQGGLVTNLGWFDNMTSSLTVTSPHSARLFQYTQYRGHGSVVFWQGSNDLSTWAFPGGGTWDNRASSVY